MKDRTYEAYAAAREAILSYHRLVAEKDEQLAAIEADRAALLERLHRIDRIADVMIGDGPGAVEAYNTRGKGLPTMYRHLVEHAREIRVLARPSPREESVEGAGVAVDGARSASDQPQT